MKVSVFLILIVGSASVAFAQGADLVPYMFEMRPAPGESEGRVIYGLVDPEHVATRPSYEVIIQEPWNRIETKERLRDSDVVYKSEESPVTRKARIESNWKAANGKEIVTPNGPVWVHESDLKLAERSLSRPDDGAETGSQEPSEVVEVEATPSSTQSPGGIGQWWMHALIVLGAGFSGALIVWFGFIRRSWSNL